VPDTNVVGIEMAGRDLARVARRDELKQLLMTLPEGEPVTLDGAPSTFVERAVALLREAGFEPSLILRPINRRFARELAGPAAGHGPASKAIPSRHRFEFEGAAGSLPILDRPEFRTTVSSC
jgi:hypothetical protein